MLGVKPVGRSATDSHPILLFCRLEPSEPQMNIMSTKQGGAPKQQAVSNPVPEKGILSKIDPIKSLSGSIRHLRAKSTDGLVLHVVSAGAGEGVTTIAHSLAAAVISNAHTNVLLLDDSDPELKEIAWSSRPIGQSVSIARSYTAPTSVQPAIIKGMLVGDDVVQADQANEIRDLYRRYRAKFDITIIDCPSINTGRYLELMPNAADGIILVVEAEKLRPIVVNRAKQLVEDHGGLILGVVLNKARRYIPNFIYKFM